jgi:hypothetical protein
MTHKKEKESWFEKLNVLPKELEASSGALKSFIENQKDIY